MYFIKSAVDFVAQFRIARMTTRENFGNGLKPISSQNRIPGAARVDQLFHRKVFFCRNQF
jgi:hypothetical protein